MREVCQLDSSPLIQAVSSSLNVQTSRFLTSVVRNSSHEARGQAVQLQRQIVGSVPPDTLLYILHISPFTISPTFQLNLTVLSKHFALGQPSMPICLIHPYALCRQCLMEIVCVVWCLVKCQSEGSCISIRSVAVLRALRTSETKEGQAMLQSFPGLHALWSLL